ncbi:MAG TPA: amidohydrolase family protein [Spirochaetota bacterium]|nr:amidohydrolase family protein [Spirochaetota bacterium]HOL56505.1 amidohydrolase family protein [Spirochaetota bacterium]HPP03953.1 amidohydrolase family protein [Spirochaetota bacterium]
MKQIVINASILFDGISKKENVNIVIEDDKIIDISRNKLKPDFSGIVTPAFIDAHSHIGMDRQGEPSYESEVNDNSMHINPLNNPLNSIYFDDRAFEEAIDFGVLYSCVVPGSGNLIGGRALIIKNFAKNRDEALIKEYGYKFALGYNPRSTTEWKGERPNTRMGVYALLENRFDSLITKVKKAEIEKKKKIKELEEKLNEKKITQDEKKEEEKIINEEFEVEFSSEDKALLELLKGEKIAKVHVHKEDDILYLIELVKKYNLKATADHTCDVFHKEIYDKLGENNIPVVFGPLGALDYKVELKHSHYKNVRYLIQSKAFFGLMTDHPVILTYNIRDTLKYFLIAGLKEEEAISIITYKNAKILGIDNILGTIEPGKKASLVVWDNSPFYFGAYPLAVIGEGKILRER